VTFTLLDETRPLTVDATVRGDAVRFTPAALREALGWELKPQGLCKGEQCALVPQGAHLEHDDGIDLAALARVLDRPLALDAAERVACLGVSAPERARQLQSLEAPDFTLPDLEGRPHTLSGFRGKKVFLVAWASW
jgi:hypothetical protein